MWKFLTTLAFVTTVFSNYAQAGPSHPIRVSIIRTGAVTIPEKIAFSGGSLFRTITLNHSAVLVDHPRGRIMFDTGLGGKIDQQFSADMPWWGHALFSYKKGTTAFTQLQLAKGRLPDLILLSHVDHDATAAGEAVRQLRRFRAANPAVTIVPAHDGSVQDLLAYFPKWLN